MQFDDNLVLSFVIVIAAVTWQSERVACHDHIALSASPEYAPPPIRHPQQHHTRI